MSPSIADMDASGEVKRLDCEYKDLSAPFRLQERDYYRQFFNLYAVRLNKMREWLLACVEKKWGKLSILYKIWRLFLILGDIK